MSKRKKPPVTPDQLATLTEFAVIGAFVPNPYRAERVIPVVREVWPMIEPYYRRRILCDIEVEVARDRGNACMTEWAALAEELMPPKDPYTVDYTCDKCDAKGLKLWRGVHGCADKNGHELLCAKCLAPTVKVDDAGKAESEYGRTDQVAGWLPAVPTGDTFWGYTSVPTADLRWWLALPTYLAPGSK
jgi:hypothetical protein